MTLADDGYSSVDCKNSLTILKTPNVFDYIITNVPYGPEGDVVKELKERTATLNQTDDKAKIINRIKKETYNRSLFFVIKTKNASIFKRRFQELALHLQSS